MLHRAISEKGFRGPIRRAIPRRVVRMDTNVFQKTKVTRRQALPPMKGLRVSGSGLSLCSTASRSMRSTRPLEKEPRAPAASPARSIASTEHRRRALTSTSTSLSGPKSIAHHAAEERKLGHLPLAAEVAEFFFVVIDSDVRHALRSFTPAFPWHFLYFFPLPHQHGSVAGRSWVPCAAPGRGRMSHRSRRRPLAALSVFCGGMARWTRCTSSCRWPSRSTTTSVFQRYFTTRS